MKSTGYSTKMTTYKTEEYLNIWERKTRGQVFTCLLAWYWQRNLLCEFTETFVYDQSGHVILHMQYCWLHFFPWILCGYPKNKWICWRFMIKPSRGENNSISHHFCKLQQHFFHLKASMLVLQKIFLIPRQVFLLDLLQ